MKASEVFKSVFDDVADMLDQISYTREITDARRPPRRIPLREGQRWQWFEGLKCWQQVGLDWTPPAPPSREPIGVFLAPVIAVMDTDSVGSDGYDEFSVWDVATGEFLMHDYGNGGRGDTFDTLQRYMCKLGYDHIEWFYINSENNSGKLMELYWNCYGLTLSPELAKKLQDEVGAGYREIEKL